MFRAGTGGSSGFYIVTEYFTPSSGIFAVGFEHVIAYQVSIYSDFIVLSTLYIGTFLFVLINKF